MGPRRGLGRAAQDLRREGALLELLQLAAPPQLLRLRLLLLLAQVDALQQRLRVRNVERVAARTRARAARGARAPCARAPVPRLVRARPEERPVARGARRRGARAGGTPRRRASCGPG